jgi:hypothetical protein
MAAIFSRVDASATTLPISFALSQFVKIMNARAAK